MFQLHLLAQSKVDWKIYTKIVEEATGQSPTAFLDEQWIQPTESLSTYLESLRKLEYPDDSWDESKSRVIGALLEHVHLSFILIATRQATMSIIMQSRLAATTIDTKHDDFHLTILSGTLSNWRAAILNSCISQVSIDVRQFGTKLLSMFEEMKLKEFMIGQYKVHMADGTIRLIEKR